jgi:hypothetical protein
MTATESQTKIAEIMASLDLEAIAQRYIDAIAGDVADHADLIALARMEEKGIENSDSHDAIKIYNAAEAMITAAILRHMGNINSKK